MANYFRPVVATVDREGKTFTVTKFYNQYFSNREQAERELGHPCPFNSGDYAWYKKNPAWKVVRADLQK